MMMALPPTALEHLGFAATVLCENEPLPIYNIERVDNKVTGWIASEAGKVFSVQTRIVDASQRISVAARLYVDGTRIAGKVMGTIPPYTDQQVTIYGPSTSPTTVQKLVFSNLAMSDDDSAIRDSNLLAELGTLNLKVVRVTAGGATTFVPVSTASLQKNETVHEQAKKLGGHRTTLGYNAAMPAQAMILTTDLGVHVEFEFRYRPRDVLQAMDIIPLPRAEPAKRPRESGLNDSTNAPRAKKQKVASGGEATTARIKRPKPEPVENDLQAMRDRIRKLEARLRERDGRVTDGEDGKDDDETPIKREPELINAGRFFAKGEVIDLTDD